MISIDRHDYSLRAFVLTVCRLVWSAACVWYLLDVCRCRFKTQGNRKAKKRVRESNRICSASYLYVYMRVCNGTLIVSSWCFCCCCCCFPFGNVFVFFSSYSFLVFIFCFWYIYIFFSFIRSDDAKYAHHRIKKKMFLKGKKKFSSVSHLHFNNIIREMCSHMLENRWWAWAFAHNFHLSIVHACNDSAEFLLPQHS